MDDVPQGQRSTVAGASGARRPARPVTGGARRSGRWAALALLVLATLSGCGGPLQDAALATESEGSDAPGIVAHAPGASDPATPPAAAPWSSTGSRGSDATAEAHRLLARADAGEEVRVIVELAAPSAAEPGLGRAAVTARSDEIARVQRAVQARAPGGSLRAVRLLTLSPHLAATVDAGGLRALLADPDVVAVHEDRLLRPFVAQSVALVGAPAVWDRGATGNGQAIAVIDSGVAANHPFFGGRVVAEACFSTGAGSAVSLCPAGSNPEGADQQIGAGAAAPCAGPGCDHGTHVAGIAAGSGGPDGASGVAPGAGIVAVQVFSSFPSACDDGTCLSAYTSDVIRGLEFVLQLAQGGGGPYAGLAPNVAAVNLSLGVGAHPGSCDWDPMKRPIDALRAAGVATIAASGNGSSTGAMSSPACISSAIAVGSTGDGSHGAVADEVSWFSNSSPTLALLAPGDAILSAVPGGGYAVGGGTSMAAPHVAGAWALVRDLRPEWGVARTLEAFAATGLPVTDTRRGADGRVTPRIRVAHAVDHVAADTAPGILWHQPPTGLASVVSTRSTTQGAGAYTAADFTLAAASDVHALTVYGHDPSATLTSQANVRWFVYGDAGGAPAGRPDGGGSPLWSFAAPPAAPFVTATADGATLALDLCHADVPDLSLAAGTYWLVVAPDYGGPVDGSAAAARWNWRRADALGATSTFVSPTLFGGLAPDWTPIDPDLGVGFTDVALRIDGAPTGAASASAAATLSVDVPLAAEVVVPPGSSDVPALAFGARTGCTSSGVALTGLTLRARDASAFGTPAVATGALTQVRVYDTATGGIGAGAALVASGPGFASSPTVFLPLGQPIAIASGAERSLIVVVDVAPSLAAPPGTGGPGGGDGGGPGVVLGLVLGLPAAAFARRRGLRLGLALLVLVATLVGCGGVAPPAPTERHYVVELVSVSVESAGGPVEVVGIPATGGRIRIVGP